MMLTLRFHARRILRQCIPLVILATGMATAKAQSASFTIEQALSAPYTSSLTAAPSKGRFAWVGDANGRRNIWVADPAGSGYTSHAITHYSEDDGQMLSALTWTPDAESILYVRGSAAQGESHPVPNPEWAPLGAKQQIWMVSLAGSEPTLLAEGSGPSLSPDGKSLAYVAHGQVYLLKLDEEKPKSRQLLQTRGSAGGILWSPNGKNIAFVSNRGDHSFIAVYNFAANAINYLDPSTDKDANPTWSPESTHIVFVRTPVDKSSLFFGPHHEGTPWSIRIADVVSGAGHEIFHASEGSGSVFHEVAVSQQLYWTIDDKIIFPWEGDGFLHLYSLPVSGGKATVLTPGKFEVEHVAFSHDRKRVVFDSDQHDIDPLDFDRRHIWELNFPANGAPKAITSGDGIETQPVIASDNATVAVLRSDARLPIRAAVITGKKIVDLAPQAIPSDFPSAQFVVPQQVFVTAADGLQIHAQLFLPKNMKPGERHPAMVFFHGGSMRQMLLGWHYMEYYSNAYAMNQYLVSQGYIVLSVNYRSGIGYGLDFREFPNYGATGASEYNDVVGAGLYLKNRSDVDPTRIGAWGGSYGGYLTAMALARSSDLYAAGVDFEGVHNWNTELTVFSPYYDPNARADAARLAYDSSPIASVSTWRSPVFLVDDDDDRNVPFAQTEELINALRTEHVYFEELIYVDEVHDLLLHRDWVRGYKASADFLTRKMPAKN